MCLLDKIHIDRILIFHPMIFVERQNNLLGIQCIDLNFVGWCSNQSGNSHNHLIDFCMFQDYTQHKLRNPQHWLIYMDSNLQLVLRKDSIEVPDNLHNHLMHHDLPKYHQLLIFYPVDKVCMLYFLLKFDNFQEHTLCLRKKQEGKEAAFRIPTTPRIRT